MTRYNCNCECDCNENENTVPENEANTGSPCRPGIPPRPMPEMPGRPGIPPRPTPIKPGFCFPVDEDLWLYIAILILIFLLFNQC